jgi:hypothetical protein
LLTGIRRLSNWTNRLLLLMALGLPTKLILPRGLQLLLLLHGRLGSLLTNLSVWLLLAWHSLWRILLLLVHHLSGMLEGLTSPHERPSIRAKRHLYILPLELALAWRKRHRLSPPLTHQRLARCRCLSVLRV